MKRVTYITFNDAPSGIYSGQVIDVCRFWNEELNVNVQLVAFISIRGFRENKTKLKKEYPSAIILPMFPKTRNWKLNRFILSFYLRKNKSKIIVGRGAFATGLALYFKKERKVCFDGRGAYFSELNEYDVVPDEKVKNEILLLEKKVVLESDFRIAVSEELVNYWKRKFNYQGINHVVIPCTLNRNFGNVFSSKYAISEVRKNMGFNEEDIIIAFSGSGAGWQSLEMLSEELIPVFEKNINCKLLLLVKEMPKDFKLKMLFPDRIQNRWLKTEEVIATIEACDYGWMVREQSETNRVASPVKFAEYLAAGLNVIISENLGDYSQFVIKHKAGFVFDPKNIQVLELISEDEKVRMKKLAIDHFTKGNFSEQYFKLLQ